MVQYALPRRSVGTRIYDNTSPDPVPPRTAAVPPNCCGDREELRNVSQELRRELHKLLPEVHCIRINLCCSSVLKTTLENLLFF